MASWADPSMGSAPPTTGDGKPSWLNASTPDSSPSAGEAQADSWTKQSGDVENQTATTPPSTKSRNCGGKCLNIFLLLVGAIFLGLFLYAAISNSNDNEGHRIHWIIFYSFHCVLPAVALFYYFFWFPRKFLFVLCGGMLIWSTVLMITYSVKTSKTESGEPGSDIDGRDTRTEYMWEAIGGGIGMLSCLYHLGMITCFNKSKANE